MSIEVQYSDKRDMYPVTNWCLGKFYNRGNWYKFESKIFENPSHFGINGGRISLLWVKSETTGKVVFNYDRGFELKKYEDMAQRGQIAELIDHLEHHAQGL